MPRRGAGGGAWQCGAGHSRGRIVGQIQQQRGASGISEDLRMRMVGGDGWLVLMMVVGGGGWLVGADAGGGCFVDSEQL